MYIFESPPKSPPPAISRSLRLIISVSVGILVGLAASLQLGTYYPIAGDLSWPILGAALLGAKEPVYAAPTLYPRNLPLFYPVPALMIVAPFALLPPTIAAILFVAISASLLTFGLLHDGYGRLALLLSAPFWSAVIGGQWSPLIVAAALLPNLLPLALAKPNIGLPVIIAYPSKRGLLGCAIVVCASLIVLPTWPIEWLGNLGSHQNMLPLRTVPGLLLLLAAPRWRDPDARLLLGLACLPQRFPDLLPLWLIFREPRLALIVSALSWFITLFWHPEQMEISSLSANLAVIVLYLPALMVILRRPKLGTPMTPAREDSGRDH